MTFNKRLQLKLFFDILEIENADGVTTARRRFFSVARESHFIRLSRGRMIHLPAARSQILQIEINASPWLFSCHSIGGGQKILNVGKTRKPDNFHRR
jgi:hypothetical protein